MTDKEIDALVERGVRNIMSAAKVIDLDAWARASLDDKQNLLDVITNALRDLQARAEKAEKERDKYRNALGEADAKADKMIHSMAIEEAAKWHKEQASKYKPGSVAEGRHLNYAESIMELRRD